MLEESVVLGREEGVDDHLWNVRGGDRDAPLLADLRDQLAVAGIDREWQLHAQVA